MKLKQISIKNFRGLKGDNNVIRFDECNIIFLIGQNDVGKSTFLQAFDFFINPKQKACITDFYDENDNVPIEIEAWFTKELKDDDDPDLQENNKNKKDEPNWIDKWVDDKNLIKIKKIWKSTTHLFEKQTFSPKNGKWKEGGFGGLHQRLKKYAPCPIFINAIETPDSLESAINDLIKSFLIPLQEDSHEDVQNKIRELQNKSLSSEDIEQINNSMNEEFKEVFPQLKLKINPKEDEIDIQKLLAKNHSLTLQKDGEDKPNNFKQHGHGVFRQAFFNALKALIPYSTNSHSYLILFEEPEVFLHPKAIFKLRKMLYELAEKTQFQILCATHSPSMIDLSKPHTSLVRIIKDKDKNTHSFQVDDNVFSAASEASEDKNFLKMLNRFNPHICEAFYADTVLLVEGDTEMIVYRCLLSEFIKNKDIFVLNTGSKTNIPFFQKILTHFMIKYYVIHDEDSKINKNGNNNSAYTLNGRIKDLVLEANKKNEGLAKFYIFKKDFEEAHSYKHDVKKGKPLSAYNFAKNITDINKNLPCLDVLRELLDDQSSEIKPTSSKESTFKENVNDLEVA